MTETSTTVPVAQARHRLELDLPAAWTVLDQSSATQTLEQLGDTAMARAEIQSLLSYDVVHPDLIANVAVPLQSDDGSVLGILGAALVVVTIPAAEAPPLDDPVYHAVTSHVPFAGKQIGFRVVTYPIRSDDGTTLSLLTFASPNVPLAELLDDGFQSIAATARLIVATR